MSGYPEPPPRQRAYVPTRAPGEHPARNGLGTTALVLGITSSVVGLVWALFWLAAALGLLALALGLTGRCRTSRGEATHRGTTTFGAVLGVIALALSGIGAVLVTKAAADTTPAPTTAPHLSADPRPALR
ncbi:hypothetical protein ACIRP2_24275 [Streptomyces sp. NPDC101194]|uniref:hypothetical protein n=1 Tax=Streptomyces sp. NPDC101194 TaxID=3366127 RepID=UPI003815511D